MGSRGADITGRHKRLALRTLLVSSLTLVSRILGLVREMLTAALFGHRSEVLDAFLTAWRVPNLFRRFLGEGALSTSFQTALTEVDGNHGEDAGRALFRDTASLLLKLLIAVALIVMGVAWVLPDRMPVTGWSWLGEDPAPVRELTVRVMPFVVLVCLSALVGGALQVRGRFGPTAWAPAILNIVWLAALTTLWFAYGPGQGSDDARDLEMARWLAWGVLAAGCAQLLVQVPALKRANFLGPAPPRPANTPSGWTVLKRSAPLALGAAVYQINVMLDGLMAEGLLERGGPTAHYLANRVQQFPMALIAIAATSAVFPALQAHGHQGDKRRVRDLHDRTHRGIAFVALPASAGLFVLAEPVTSVLFQHGSFEAEGVERTTAALRMLCLAILPAGAVGLVARTYYALSDFRTPVRVSMVMLVLNVVLNLWFVQGLGMDVEGLSLATAITSWGSLVLLYPHLRGRLKLPPSQTPFLGPMARMAVATAVCCVSAWGAEAALVNVLGPQLALVGAIAAGIGAYALAATALGVPEVEAIRARLARRKN